MEEKNTIDLHHQNKYSRTVEEFLKTRLNACLIHRMEMPISKIQAGLKRVVTKNYSDKVLLSRVDGELYLEKLYEGGTE